MPDIFRLQFTNTAKPPRDCEFYDEAEEEFFAWYPAGTIGHAGDVVHGGDLTYCWASDAEVLWGSAAAKATITRVHRR